MIRRPPRSTLFPTRRSSDLLDYHKTFDEYIRVKKSFFDSLPSSAFAISNADDKRGRDRKSTRLNSSHVEISYAVFCLKKKKRIYLIPSSARKDYNYLI